MVDSQAMVPTVPPRQRIQGPYALYVLLGLALFGVLVEGVFIYRLYQKISTPQGENKTWDNAHSNGNSPLSLLPMSQRADNKPAVFLHLLHPPKSPLGVIQWSDFGFPAFSRGFNYINGSLIIHTEGFYFLFSKVSFTCITFKHQVKLNSERYNNKPISLMVDNRRSTVNQIKPHEKAHFSSYLGGVWLLHKKEEVFVSLDASCLAEGQGENFFGGFMI